MGRGYFYRGQLEQFVFYRTPKALFTEPEYEKLTIPAKALYGILLDRESLSDKSGWFDDNGRIFVYMTNERSQYRQYFMEELAIDIMKERYPYDKEVIDEILELILDTVCSTRKTIGIAGEQRPIDIVKSRFMKLDSGHLEFVLQSMSDNTTLVRNMKQYLLAALYNAPLTMNNYYKSLVKHDMASGII